MADGNIHKNTKKGKRGKRNRAITVTYVNDLPIGVLESALADICAKKVKSGTLGL